MSGNLKAQIKAKKLKKKTQLGVSPFLCPSFVFAETPKKCQWEKSGRKRRRRSRGADQTKLLMIQEKYGKKNRKEKNEKKEDQTTMRYSLSLLPSPRAVNATKIKYKNLAGLLWFSPMLLPYAKHAPPFWGGGSLKKHRMLMQKVVTKKKQTKKQKPLKQNMKML